MKTPRSDVVRLIVRAALEAVVQVVKANDATNLEVFTAWFSIVRDSMLEARRKGSRMSILKDMAEQVLIECHEKEPTIQ